MNSEEIENFLGDFNTASNAHDDTLRSEAVRLENSAIDHIEQNFRTIGKRDNLTDIIQLENLFLEDRVNHNQDVDIAGGEPHAVTGEEKTRLTNCLKRSRTAMKLARKIERYEGYENFLMFNKSVSFDREGLPQDRFREFIKVDIDVIRDEQCSPITDATKRRNAARIENLRTAEKLYKERLRGHMERFAKENPDHECSEVFLKRQKRNLQHDQ